METIVKMMLEENIKRSILRWFVGSLMLHNNRIGKKTRIVSEMQSAKNIFSFISGEYYTPTHWTTHKYKSDEATSLRPYYRIQSP